MDLLGRVIAPQIDSIAFFSRLIQWGTKVYALVYDTGALYRWNTGDLSGTGVAIGGWVKVVNAAGAGSGMMANSLAIAHSKLFIGCKDGATYSWDGDESGIPTADNWTTEKSSIASGYHIHYLYTRPTTSKLYAFVQGSRLYEWSDVAKTWTKVAEEWNEGGSVQDRGDCLIEWNGYLYGSTRPNGLLLKWNGSSAWTKAAGMYSTERRILSLVVHYNELYGLGIYYESGLGGILLKYNTGTSAWDLKASQYGSENVIGDPISYGGYLYCCTGVNGMILKWNGTDAWTCLGYADKANTTYLRHLFVSQDDSYSTPLDEIFVTSGQTGSLLRTNIVNLYPYMEIDFGRTLTKHTPDGGSEASVIPSDASWPHTTSGTNLIHSVAVPSYSDGAAAYVHDFFLYSYATGHQSGYAKITRCLDVPAVNIHGCSGSMELRLQSGAQGQKATNWNKDYYLHGDGGDGNIKPFVRVGKYCPWLYNTGNTIVRLFFKTPSTSYVNAIYFDVRTVQDTAPTTAYYTTIRILANGQVHVLTGYNTWSAAAFTVSSLAGNWHKLEINYWADLSGTYTPYIQSLSIDSQSDGYWNFNSVTLDSPGFGRVLKVQMGIEGTANSLQGDIALRIAQLRLFKSV